MGFFDRRDRQRRKVRDDFDSPVEEIDLSEPEEAELGAAPAPAESVPQVAKKQPFAAAAPHAPLVHPVSGDELSGAPLADGAAPLPLGAPPPTETELPIVQQAAASQAPVANDASESLPHGESTESHLAAGLEKEMFDDFDDTQFDAPTGTYDLDSPEIIAATQRARFGFEQLMEVMSSLPLEGEDLAVEVLHETLVAKKVQIPLLLQEVEERLKDDGERQEAMQQAVTELESELLTTRKALADVQREMRSAKLAKARLAGAEKLAKLDTDREDEPGTYEPSDDEVEPDTVLPRQTGKIRQLETSERQRVTTPPPIPKTSEAKLPSLPRFKKPATKVDKGWDKPQEAKKPEQKAQAKPEAEKPESAPEAKHPEPAPEANEP